MMYSSMVQQWNIRKPWEFRISNEDRMRIVEHCKKTTKKMLKDTRHIVDTTEDLIAYKKALFYCCGYNKSGVITVIVTLKIPKGTTIVAPSVTFAYGKSYFQKRCDLLRRHMREYSSVLTSTYVNNLRRDTMSVWNDYRKCRAPIAEVLAIEPLEHYEDLPTITSACSWYERDFRYIVGKTVSEPDFEESLEACAPGIHFFLTREEAEAFLT